MANYKIVSVNIPQNEKDAVLTHYEKMGFEVINGMLITQKNEHGTVTNTYYKYNFKFDRDQKNADKIRKVYKDYKKKKAELDVRNVESVGGTHISLKIMLHLTWIVGLVLLPFIPMIFGNEFCDFTHSVGFLFDLKKEFDTVMFVSSVAIALLFGLAVGTTVAAIYAGVTKNKRMLLAIDRIPALENEIEELVNKAAELRI